jgi:hypothetical protein
MCWFIYSYCFRIRSRTDDRFNMCNFLISPLLNSILPPYVLLRGVRVFETDVSGIPLVLIFKGQAGQTLPLKFGPRRSPETSV